ncbi:alpha/beta hydrolase fold domain protein [Ralstonia insidiosa]|uniref:Alpha/beta hydrolase fold domain protein n=1 Tax=Ralstonia insidiosa TaxID=190721 RepID=A0AAC9BM34_9RALS|nr:MULTISPECIES: hypothetical protein [Ralstonia]ANH76708.1 alpha/beta hydrolase fold domain protein [Ralstonia insidiosa]EPX98850.1 hypothetical protein C404_06585 [Ralstonia sp. AU12-08]
MNRLLDSSRSGPVNHLPATRFALNNAAVLRLTPEYDFNLAMNFQPQRDFAANLWAERRPCAILAGADD